MRHKKGWEELEKTLDKLSSDQLLDLYCNIYLRLLEYYDYNSDTGYFELKDSVDLGGC